MPFARHVRLRAGGFRLGAGVIVASAVASITAAAYAANPAAAAAALAAAQSAVTCATAGTTPCSSGTNTSSGIGVLGASNTGTGIRGSANTNYGIKGTSKTSYGVLGQSTSGASGVAGMGGGVLPIGVLGSGNEGIFGSTPDAGYGVFGSAVAGIGVLGIASAAGFGVNVEAIKGTGVDIFSESGTGLLAVTNNATGTAALFASGPVALEGIAPIGGFPLRLTDNAGHVVFRVDGAGNVNYAGKLSSALTVAGGATATAFGPKTTLPTIEDSGTAQLVGGAAVVRLDPTFAAAIDTKSGYRVFLTPYGDTHGLFVAATTPAAFIVRESQAGRATVSFDYRVIATALGRAGQRMAVTTAASARVTLPRVPLSRVPPTP